MDERKGCVKAALIGICEERSPLKTGSQASILKLYLGFAAGQEMTITVIDNVIDFEFAFLHLQYINMAQS